MEQLKLQYLTVLLSHWSFNDKNHLTTYNPHQSVTLAIIAEACMSIKIALKNNADKITNPKNTGLSIINDIISEIQNSLNFQFYIIVPKLYNFVKKHSWKR